MKTRQGFVSNSSSTSFIIYLPKDFEVKDEDIGEIYEQQGMDCDYDECEKSVKKEIKLLESGGILYEEEEPGAFTIINKLAEKYDLTLIRTDGSPEDGKIEVISKEAVEKIKRFL
jgi:hypothetical protein